MMELERVVDYLAKEYRACKHRDVVDKLAYGLIDALIDSDASRAVAKQKYENKKFIR
jgi:hypothetical protein